MYTDRNFKLYNNLEFFVKSNTEDLNYLQNIKYCYDNKLLINSNKSIDDINKLSDALHLSIGLYSDIIYEMFQVFKHIINNNNMDNLTYYERNREARLEYQKIYNQLNKLKIQQYWRFYDRNEKRRQIKNKIVKVKEVKKVKEVHNIIKYKEIICSF